MRSSAFSFNFRYPLVSLRSFSNCFHLLPHLPGPFFPSVTCFIRYLPRKLWPIQSAFFVLVCVGHSFSPRLLVILLCFSRDRSNWSFHSSSLPRFNSNVSDPLSQVSSFRHHTKLCSRCGISLVSTLNLSQGSTNTYILAFRNKLKREKLTVEGRNYTVRSNAFCHIRVVDSGMTRVCGNTARIRWECMKHLSWESCREWTVWETSA